MIANTSCLGTIRQIKYGGSMNQRGMTLYWARTYALLFPQMRYNLITLQSIWISIVPFCKITIRVGCKLYRIKTEYICSPPKVPIICLISLGVTPPFLIDKW